MNPYISTMKRDHDRDGLFKEIKKKTKINQLYTDDYKNIENCC